MVHTLTSKTLQTSKKLGVQANLRKGEFTSNKVRLRHQRQGEVIEILNEILSLSGLM